MAHYFWNAVYAHDSNFKKCQDAYFLEDSPLSQQLNPQHIELSPQIHAGSKNNIEWSGGDYSENSNIYGLQQIYSAPAYDEQDAFRSKNSASSSAFIFESNMNNAIVDHRYANRDLVTPLNMTDHLNDQRNTVPYMQSPSNYSNNCQFSQYFGSNLRSFVWIRDWILIGNMYPKKFSFQKKNNFEFILLI